MLLLTRMRDTALARGLLWWWSARGVWLGPVAFALSLLGMELLRRESLRIWALLLLVGAAVMAVLAWNSSRWLAAFPVGARAGLAEAQLQVWRRRCALATLPGFPSFLRGNCSADRSMDRICGRLAARKREMDNDRGRGRRAADIGIRQYQLLFLQYYADPESLRNERYRAAQRLYEVQTTQSRYMATLGPAYRVVVVGQSPYPYDPDTTRYIVSGEEYITICAPLGQLSLDHV